METVALSAEDRVLVETLMNEVRARQTELGAEYERHLVAAAALKGSIERARAEFQSMVGALARKYIKGPGRYDFRLETGEFVAGE